MNEYFVAGFMHKCASAGLSQEQAVGLYKRAQMDPRLSHALIGAGAGGLGGAGLGALLGGEGNRGKGALMGGLAGAGLGGVGGFAHGRHQLGEPARDIMRRVQSIYGYSPDLSHNAAGKLIMESPEGGGISADRMGLLDSAFGGENSPTEQNFRNYLRSREPLTPEQVDELRDIMQSPRVAPLAPLLRQAVKEEYQPRMESLLTGGNMLQRARRSLFE